MWVAFDTEGEPLWSLNFNNDTLEVYYQLSTSSDLLDTGVSSKTTSFMPWPWKWTLRAMYGAPRWMVTLSPSRNPSPAPNSGRILGDVDAAWVPQFADAPGNNFMLFDNYRVTTAPDPKPVIVLHPRDLSVLAGENALLGVIANGGEPLQYQWRQNLIDIPGATNAILILNNLSSRTVENYSVVVSNRSRVCQQQSRKCCRGRGGFKPPGRSRFRGQPFSD